MQDLLSGQVDLLIPQPPIALPLVTERKIKAYAVTAKQRLSIAPNIPTAEEAGVPGFELSVWHGLWAPKDTPKSAIAVLNAAVVAALAHPTVQKTLADIGQDIPKRDAPSGACQVSEGRNRQMVAGYQGRQHQS